MPEDTLSRGRNQPIRVYRKIYLDPAQPLKVGDIINTGAGTKEIVSPELPGLAPNIIAEHARGYEMMNHQPYPGPESFYDIKDFDFKVNWDTIISAPDLSACSFIAKDGIKYLDLANKGITQILADLTEFDVVNISNNKLKEFPEFKDTATVYAYNNPVGKEELVFIKLLHRGKLII